MTTRFQRLIELGLTSDGARKATYSLVALQALTVVSKFVNYYRIKYEENTWHTVFPSTLAVIEAPTGSGKNSVYNFYSSTVFKFPFEYMESCLEVEAQKLVKEYEIKLEKDLERECVGKDETTRNKLALKYKKMLEAFERGMRDPVLDHWDDGSYEGFAKQRAFLARLPVGSKTIRSNEFGDRIRQMKNNTHLVSMFARFFELVDDDKLMAKHIKDKDGTTEGSSGLATTLLLTYAPMDRNSRETVKTYISQSIGRRGFLLRETNESIQFFERAPYDPSLMEDLEGEVRDLTTSLEGKIGWTLPITPEAKAWFESYRKRYMEVMNDIYLNRPASERKDMDLCILQDKDRKVLRLAVLLAVFNHGEEDFALTVADLEEAQVFVDKFVDSAQSFFDMTAYSQTNTVLAYLMDQKSEWVSARTLFELGLFKEVKRDNFQMSIKEIMLRDINASANVKDLKVAHMEKNRQDLYRLEALTYDDRFLLKEEVEEKGEESVKHYFSFNRSSNPKVTAGYELCDVADLAGAMSSDVSYSAIKWSGGVRKAENFEGASLIILDFDEGITMAEAGKEFNEYKLLIAPTKHHQIAKDNKPACDRFRLVLFSDMEFKNLADFKLVMAEMTRRFKSDPACKDGARFYFGAPGKKVMKNKSERLFPAKAMLAMLKSKKEPEKRRYLPRVNENSVPSFLLNLGRGEMVDARSYIQSLPLDKTFPVCCPFHEDKNPSAFVCHQTDGGLQITCSSCGVTKFIS